MRYKIYTKQVDNNEYVTDCIFISEFNNIPLSKYVIDYPLKNITNDEGLFNYILVENEIVKSQQFPPKEVEEKRKSIDVLKKINEEYDRNEEIKLLNKAIIALSKGEDLPKEYLEYRSYIDEVTK